MSLPTWTDELSIVYIATGDLLQACTAVGMRPSHYYAALDSIPVFAEHMRGVRRQAHQTATRIILTIALGSDNAVAFSGYSEFRNATITCPKCGWTGQVDKRSPAKCSRVAW